MFSVAVPFRLAPDVSRAAGDAQPRRGARVLVPLGTRTVTGLVVVDRLPRRSKATSRTLIEVLDEEPFLPAAIVDLALWVSDYYLAGPGDTLAAAMPPGAWVESQLRYRLTASGRRSPSGSRRRDAADAGARPSGQRPEDAAGRALTQASPRSNATA